MTERPTAGPRSTPGAFHLQTSRLFVIAVILATAATGALIVTVLVGLPGPPPGPPPGQGNSPPPPDLRALAAFSVVTGFFVLSWLAVLVIFARDQILGQLRQHHDPVPVPGLRREEVEALLADLRVELAGDRDRELRALDERMAEYGERRETDGYLSGMRAAAAHDPPDANVRALRRTPPQR